MSAAKKKAQSFRWHHFLAWMRNDPITRRKKRITILPDVPAINPAAWFLRGLALVYLFAFSSAFIQLEGLLGSDGILPVRQYLAAIATQFGFTRFFLFPTVAWLSSSDFFLQCYCLLGIACSIGFLTGLRPRLWAIALWILYFSLVAIGQDFYGYQWDALLLEAGFLAIWLSPLSSIRYAHASTVLTWLFRLLLFRLIFSSGVAKWTSGDPLWQSWEALKVHYETQPLPTPIGWYFHQLPAGFHKVCTFLIFVIEVVVPIFFFFPTPFRRVAMWFQLLLQGLIALTGNYTFFNLLTALLCLFLLNSPDPVVDELELARPPIRIPWLPYAKQFFVGLWTVAGLLHLLTLFNVPIFFGSKVLETMERYYLINRYGLFAVMTPLRYELEIQGSRDGKEWKIYELPWKPDRLNKAPSFIAPYQPRLDWQLWFAALSRFEETTWLNGLVKDLLEGQPDCLALFRENPFPGTPPKYLRILKYEYHFTDFKERQRTGNWWYRYLLGNYTPVLSLTAKTPH